jgi:hypothetical protein
MAAVVESDDPPPGLGQGLNPQRKDPIDRVGRGEAVYEEHGLPSAASCGHLVDEG